MLSVNASRALWRETLSRRRIHYIKVREAIREGQTPCVSFHGQKVLGCGFMHLGTNHCVVGGEGSCWVRSRWTWCRWHHRVTGTKDRVSLQSGHMLSGPPSDTRASGLWSGGWALWWRRRLPESLQIWGWEQLPAFDNWWVVSCTTILLFLVFSPFIIYVTNFLHGTLSPVVGFSFPD